MLFIPGNNPGMLQNGCVFGADSAIFDLEDAVALTEKDAARRLVANALKYVDYGPTEKVVRINSLDTFAQDDIRAIVPEGPDALLVPKVQAPGDIVQVAAMVEAVEIEGREPIQLIALMETPQGIAEAYSIAKAHPRLTGLALGAEDYTALLGIRRSPEGDEIYLARGMVVNAAAAAGIQPIDTPFTDVNDMAGLSRDTDYAKKLGFKGKLAINPRQIAAIHQVFTPSREEVQWAKRVIAALRQANSEGAGVASLDGKMVDAPIVSRAEQVIYLAQTLGLA